MTITILNDEVRSTDSIECGGGMAHVDCDTCIALFDQAVVAVLTGAADDAATFRHGGCFGTAAAR